MALTYDPWTLIHTTLILYQSDICNAVALHQEIFFYIHHRLRGALTTGPVTLSKQTFFFTGIPQISF